MQFQTHSINQTNGYHRAFVFECHEENQQPEETVACITLKKSLKESIFAPEPPLCSEPQSLYSQTNEIREWDAICWDSVASHNGI